jgi:hypothetical protein
VSGKSRQLVEAIGRKRESVIRVPETQSAFHRRERGTPSVITIRVGNPDLSPVGINR